MELATMHSYSKFLAQSAYREVGSKNLTLRIFILSWKKNTDEVCLSACDYVVVVVRTGYDSALTGKSQFLL